MNDIKLTTLDNGLRLITDRVDTVESVALGIWAGVGTRDENLKDNGVAHMVEHMLFKGTNKRTASQIAGEIEAVGGSMNAYTSRELTSYHIHLLKDDAPLALEVLADMYTASNFPDAEIERERQVILQEIGMCNDTPDDLVFDLHSENAYPDQAFGAPILGRAENIHAMSREALTGYVSDFYNVQNSVIVASGNIDHVEFAAQVSDALGALPKGQAHTRDAARYEGGDCRIEKELEQAHFVLGFDGVSRFDEEYYAAQALSTLLGGGMSSRLFQEVREKRGLVYSIFSFHSGYRDCGQFGIYAGTGADDLKEIMPVICDEVLKIAHDAKEDELARAKAQLKASLLMNRESMMSRADQNARTLLLQEKLFTQQDLIEAIEGIDLKAISRIAKKIFSSKPTLTALGPVSALESYEAIQNRLAA